MIKSLLIEIIVEELPAIPFLKELVNIESKWENILEKNDLLSNFNFYYTPRRFVFWHREFKTVQDDKELEIWGAPVSIAYKDGEPTGAAIAFAKKCEIDISEITTSFKGDKEFLYYKKRVKGQDSKELLEDMINEFITSLTFGKSMRWGSLKQNFIRPIRNLTVLLGEELVNVELFGIKSSKTSLGHRMVSYEPFEFDFAGDYFCKLDKNGVILYPQERKKMIVSQMEKIEKENNIKIEVDEELLEEIVAITEYPTALIGKFDSEFLELPNEVIIGSMKEHQRYFAVYNKNGELTNNFIVVSNAYTKDFSYIISGNERVLKPRLADGMFFWNNDIKNGLNNEGLKDINFVDKLGSMYDKTLRELDIAKKIAKQLNYTENQELLEEAILLSKADLLTDMVYEFTDLQATMGYYYAKQEGKNELVCTAIKEQYLPKGEDSLLPSNLFSSIVSISNKLDSLMGLFSVNMLPTGSRDPFALRRAAAGIYKICYENKIDLDLNKIIDNLLDKYEGLNKTQLSEFLDERLYKLYSDVNPSVVKAVLNSTGDNTLLSIPLKIEAIDEIVKSSSFKSISDTFKRVANIISDMNIDKTIEVNDKLFEDKEESNLYNKFLEVKSKKYKTFDEELDALFSLKPQLDAFFDNVFVNHKDERIKNNRKNIVATIYNSFKTIADIKEITI